MLRQGLTSIANAGYWIVLLACACPASSLQHSLQSAPATTRTELYVSTDASIYSGKVVNLKAWVSVDRVSVTNGIVRFCDAVVQHCSGNSIFGEVELRSSGTAEMNFIPSRGTHKIQAVFLGTATNASSSSAISPLTVTGPQFSSSSSISANSVGSSYTLVGTVNSVGSPLSGTMAFLDASNGDSQLAKAILGPEALSFVFLPPTLPPGDGIQLTADFDGDGRLDQAVSTQGGVSILRGQGDGTFLFKTSIDTGTAPTSIVAGDFNNDDLPDLILLNEYAGTVAILLGHGDGTFAAPADLPVNLPYPAAVSVGDFNNDGNADIAVSYAYNGLETFLGDGRGSFTRVPASTSLGSSASQLALGDFNRDGNEDVVVADIGGPVTLLLGNGDGSFHKGADIDITCDDACPSVVAADFNGDGNLDLAIADRGELDNFTGNLYVLFGDGKGDFRQHSATGGWFFEGLAVGDFNGDGIPDVVAGNNVYAAVNVYLGDGDGNFSQSINIPSTTSNFLVGDFNNDEKSDLIVDDPNKIALSEVQASATVTGVSLVTGEAAQKVFAKYEGNKTHRRSIPTNAAILSPP